MTKRLCIKLGAFHMLEILLHQTKNDGSNNNDDKGNEKYTNE